MRFGRFFVTIAAILSLLATVSCSKSAERKAKEKKAARQEMNKALLAEGETLLTQTDEQRKELDDLYKIWIRDEPIKVAADTTRDHRTLGRDYNWERLNSTERQAVKEKLAALMTGYARILEIDAKKGVYITHIKKIKDRKLATESHQISLSNFEKLHGEQYNPQGGTGPVYKNL